MTGTTGGLRGHRKLTDPRLLQAVGRCPDDGTAMTPTGDAYSEGLTPARDDWLIAYHCPLHPEETIRLWQQAMQPLLDEVLTGVDVTGLPVVGPGLR